MLFHCLNPEHCQTFYWLAKFSFCCLTAIHWSLHWWISFKPLHSDLITLACLICVRKFLRVFHRVSDKGLFFLLPVGDNPWEREAVLPAISWITWNKCQHDGGILPAAGSECFPKLICPLTGQFFHVFLPEHLGLLSFHLWRLSALILSNRT